VNGKLPDVKNRSCQHKKDRYLYLRLDMRYALHILRFSNRWQISISENRWLGVGFDCHGQISQKRQTQITWNVQAKTP
jgi:hypothetical protein